MIETLLSSHSKSLCSQEIMLITNFFNCTNDIKAAELLADKLAAKGYGLALNRASPVDVEAINCEIIKYDIAEITHTSIEYINALPYDIRDELVDFYDRNKNINQHDFLKKLHDIMNLSIKNATSNQTEKKRNNNSDAKKPKVKSAKPSLLGKLKKYESMIQKGL